MSEDWKVWNNKSVYFRLLLHGNDAVERVGEVGGGAGEYGAGVEGCRKILYASLASFLGEEAGQRR